MKTHQTDESKITASREDTMTKIDALVHHHCRDHCLCTVDTCLYRQADRHHLARKDVKFLGVDKNTRAEYMDKPRDEQLNLVRDGINKDYAENSRLVE